MTPGRRHVLGGDEDVETSAVRLMAHTVDEARGEAESRDDLLGRWTHYRHDPVAFVEEQIAPGRGVAPYQAEVLRDMDAERRVAWKACHGAGKSAVLAWATLWWLLSRPMSRVLLLAPTLDRQLSRYLLPEVEKWVDRAVRSLPVDVQGRRAVVEGYGKRWNAQAVQGTDPDKIEGLHAENVAVLADEARGLPADVVDALQGTQTDPEGDKLYALVSVPGAEEGPFYECWNDAADMWATHHVDAHQAVAEGQVDPEWPEERARDWGKDSPIYRRKVLALFADAVEGAHWDEETLSAGRIPVRVHVEERTEADPAGRRHRHRRVRAQLAHAGVELGRIVVGLDPSGSKHGDEAGVVAAGLAPCARCAAERGLEDPPEHGFVLEDESGQLSAAEWARRAVRLYERWRADRIAAEKNYGGEMVRQTLRGADGGDVAAVKLVSAKKGKSLRAAPVATLYEDGKVHHVGTLPDLESQMTGWDPVERPRQSPDRVDALVYALTELFHLDRRKPPDEARRAAPSVSTSSHAM